MTDHKTPVLLPYQTTFNNDKSSVAVWEKSRRIGASFGLANEALLHTASGAGNVYYMAYDKDMTEGFIKDCGDWADKLQIVTQQLANQTIISDDKQILIYRIRTDSGKLIQALPSVARGLRSKGRPGDLVIIDEAAFCDDLDELLKAAIAFTIWGGKVRILSTHNGDNNPFNLLINDIRSGRVDYALHRTTFDEAINQGFWDKICQVTKTKNTTENYQKWYDKILHQYRHNKDEELFCIPSQGTGAYLPRSLIEPQMRSVPVVSFKGDNAFNILPVSRRKSDIDDWIKLNLDPLLKKLSTKETHFFGQDFARSGDTTTMAPMVQKKNLTRVVPFLVELHNVPFAQQQQILLYLLSGLPKFSGAKLDGTGNGAQIAESAVDKFGSIVESIHFTESFYREYMPKYKSAFEDKNLFIPQTEDVLEDHRAIAVINGVPKLPKTKTDAKNKRHGDSVIAIWLGYLASLSDVVPFDFASKDNYADFEINNDGFGAVSSGLAFDGYVRG